MLSWNGLEHLETVVASLDELEDPGVEWELLVLDNGSSDGTSAWLEREAHGSRRLAGKGTFRWLRSEHNLGFCGGNNLLARKTEADALVLLNNDTRVTASWLGNLVEGLAQAPADVAAVSGRIVDWAGERNDFQEGLVTFDGHAFQRDYRRPLAKVPVLSYGHELPFACGGNMIIRRSSFEAAGRFDEAFFAYLEDVDLGWRLWSGGERVVLAPDAIVHHRSMATSALLGVYNRGFLFERNALLNIHKNLDDELWPRLMPVIELTLLARTRQLLVDRNADGHKLAVDPYVSEASPTPPSPPPLGRRDRWRRRLARWIAPRSEVDSAVIDDPQSIAQLRAISSLLSHLDRSAERRAEIRRRRRRPDREYLERFPLFVVPTYPGDEDLFGSAGFRAWLPDDVPLEFAALEEIMDLDG